MSGNQENWVLRRYPMPQGGHRRRWGVNCYESGDFNSMCMKRPLIFVSCAVALGACGDLAGSAHIQRICKPIHSSRHANLLLNIPMTLRLRGGADGFEAGGTERPKEYEEYWPTDNDMDFGQDDGRFDNITGTWVGMDGVDPDEPAIGSKYKVGDYVVPMDQKEHMSERMKKALEMARNSDGLVDDDEAWWRMMDDGKILAEGMQDFLDETVCMGTGPHTMIGYRFDGKKVRDKRLYNHPNETDEQMFGRHIFGWATNNTLMGLHKLQVAVDCLDTIEIERLVKEDGVDVNGLIDEIGFERAIHFAAWNGDREVVRVLFDLGADVNVRNYYNQTALHRAASGGYTALCDDLVKYGGLPLVEDHFTFQPATWAAYNAKNETAQWFYAKFIHRNGSVFPRGPPPFYGLEPCEGYDYFHPFEVDEEPTPKYFINQMEPFDWGNKTLADTVFERAHIKAWQNEEMEEAMAEAAKREEEVRALKAQKRKEAGYKRKILALGSGATYPENIEDTDL